MRVAIKQCDQGLGPGLEPSLHCADVQGNRLTLSGRVGGVKAAAFNGLQLELVSGPHRWTWPLRVVGGGLDFHGQLCMADVVDEVVLALSHGDASFRWLTLEIHRSETEQHRQWCDFFSGKASVLPGPDLEAVASRSLQATAVEHARTCPAPLSAFCRIAARQDLVLAVARLRHQGLFPSVLGQGDGRVLASRLVLNWNVLLIQEGDQRFFVFQGVTSCDALLLPGLNLMVLVCHLDAQRVINCVQILCRNPEVFYAVEPATFGGYLVGHSRPYHCFYDGLLALQYVKQSGELSPGDPLFSKEDEAFVDLSACLGLPQPHQLACAHDLNRWTQQRRCYLMQLGFWFHTGAQDPGLRQLAAAVDSPLRSHALAASQLANIGGLETLERCEPLLWLGITGQKRSWLEQVDGSAALLNTLYQVFPRLGVVFDGWTLPLAVSDYHRSESRKDDAVIRRIIRRLDFPTRGRIGVIAGLPLLEKVRVGMATHAFVANYTTGSLNVARICGKPGVGHMGRRMMASKHQHIHHRTREIDPDLVQDRSDPGTPTGYVNYSLPWQALYNALLEVLAELPIQPSQPLDTLEVPTPS